MATITVSEFSWDKPPLKRIENSPAGERKTARFEHSQRLSGLLVLSKINFLERAALVRAIFIEARDQSDWSPQRNKELLKFFKDQDVKDGSAELSTPFETSLKKILTTDQLNDPDLVMPNPTVRSVADPLLAFHDSTVAAVAEIVASPTFIDDETVRVRISIGESALRLSEQITEVINTFVGDDFLVSQAGLAAQASALTGE